MKRTHRPPRLSSTRKKAATLGLLLTATTFLAVTPPAQAALPGKPAPGVPSAPAIPAPAVPKPAAPAPTAEVSSHFCAGRRATAEVKDEQIKRFEREEGDDEVIVMLDTNELEIRAENPTSANYGDRENVYAVDKTLEDMPGSRDIVVCGTEDADVVISNSESVIFHGGSGGDHFTGDAKAVYGNNGDDHLTVSPGNYGTFTLWVNGGAGNDTIVLSAPDRQFPMPGRAYAHGSSGDDSVTNNSPSMSVIAKGGTGTDTATGLIRSYDFEHVKPTH